MVPELIKTTWIVGQGEGKGWVDASGMRAVSASSQEASAEATNARQTLSRAADVVRVYVCPLNSVVPILSAFVNMPASEMLMQQ